MAVPSLLYVTAGARLLAATWNGLKDYVDFLLDRPGCHAYRTVAGSIPTATWSGAVGMDLELFDRDDMHNTAVANSRITFATAGRYRLTFRFTFDSNATGLRRLEIRQNSAGSQTGGSFLAEDIRSAVSGGNTTLEITFSRFFDTGAYVEMFAYQTSGATLSYVTGAHRCSAEALFVGSN